MDTTIEQLLYGGWSLSIWHIRGGMIGAELWCPSGKFHGGGATVAEAIDDVVQQLLAPEQSGDEALRQEEELR